VEPPPPDSYGAVDRRSPGAERREIDAHRVELVEALDRADTRSWPRDVLFMAIGALVGAAATLLLGLVAG
jgi:hypothetical protein